MENVSNYRKIAKALNEGKIVTKKTKITEDRFLEERFSGRFTLVICGGGHISKSLSSMAKLLGYQIWIVDDREEFANQERFPQADRVFCMDFQEAFEKLDVSESAWYVIVTRGHQNDYECLRNVLTRKSSYVGMIGSRKKVDITSQRLREEGFTRADRLRACADRTSDWCESPEEITVSILAEMVQERAKLRVLYRTSKRDAGMAFAERRDNGDGFRCGKERFCPSRDWCENACCSEWHDNRNNRRRNSRAPCSKESLFDDKRGDAV